MPHPVRWLRRHPLWSALLLVLVVLSAWQGLRQHDDDEGATPVAPAPLAVKPAPPSPDGIPLVGTDAAAVRQASADTAWGGPRSGLEPTLSDRVVNYRIEARLDPDRHTVDGKEALRWRNRSTQAVHAIYLHLYLNAFEGEGSTFLNEHRHMGFDFREDVPIKSGEWGHTELRQVSQQGKPLPWYYVQPDGGPTSDRSVVRVDLDQPVPPGGELQLDIGFFDQLPRVVARTGYFGTFHLVGQWFPKIAVLELPGERGATAPRWNAHEFHLHSEFYADYGLYDVSIDVPEGYTVGATGEEQGEPVKAKGRSVHRFVQGDVHDFAWTADRRTAPPLMGSYAGEGSPPVSIKVLFPPEYASNAPVVLKATQDALAWFSKTLGPYPYRTVTAVIPPYNAGEAGGMEYPTFFTADSVRDPTPGTLAHAMLEFVTIHEFGHGYFYGILGSNEFEEPLLDEGMNEFWDMRMLAARGERMPLAPRWLQRLGVDPRLDVFDFERLTAGLQDPPDGLGANSWQRHSSESYLSVYSRSATAFRGLEHQLGTETLEKAFKLYYQRWKFRHPSAADLRDTLAEASGKPALVQRFFDQHVYASQKVDDRVESLSSVEELPLLGRAPAAGGSDGELTEEARDRLVAATRKAWKKAHPDARPDDPGPFPYRSTVLLRRSGAAQPQTLVVSFADGSRETVIWDDDARWKRYSWVKPVKAVSAELDPQGWQPLELNRLDNSRRLKPDAKGLRRVMSDIGSVVMSLITLVSTL